MFRYKEYIWIFLFILLNGILIQKGNPNPASRLAVLAALCESGTLRIDQYATSELSWTQDWARTSNGAYYSNKAPGPMLVAFPVFWIIDQWVVQGLTDTESRFIARRCHLPLYNIVLSTLFQVIPFAIVVFLGLRWMRLNGYSSNAIHFSALAILFGNTAALLMNTFFGHGLTAVCLLSLLVSILYDRPGWAGGFLGAAALCDYGTLWLIPPALLSGLILWRDQTRSWRWAVWGFLFPALLWGGYHTICFGAPWRIALQFQNPIFRDTAGPAQGLSMIMAVVPNASTLWELLFGFKRGIFVTQPWILAVFVMLLLGLNRVWDNENRKIMATNLFAITGFISLLWMNGSFGGWHGGLTIGPRYLSGLFPIFGLCAVWVWPIKEARIARRFLWGLLGVSLILCGLVFSTTLYAPPEIPLWTFLTKSFWETPSGIAWARVTLFSSGFLGALLLIRFL